MASSDRFPTAFDEQAFGMLLGVEFLEYGKMTSEGHLVTAVSVPILRIFAELERNPSLLFEFSKDPTAFEQFIAGAYDLDGWEVTLTPRSGDLGRDVIATKTSFPRIRIMEQCKAFSRTRKVNQNDVRAMIGVLSSDPGATKAIITTTNEFAPGVASDPGIQGLLPYRLELRDGAGLLSWLKGLKGR